MNLVLKWVGKGNKVVNKNNNETKWKKKQEKKQEKKNQQKNKSIKYTVTKMYSLALKHN